MCVPSDCHKGRLQELCEWRLEGCQPIPLDDGLSVAELDADRVQQGVRGLIEGLALAPDAGAVLQPKSVPSVTFFPAPCVDAALLHCA